MSLFEVRMTMAFAAAEQASDILSEAGEDAWSVVEDLVSRQAWLVGIFTNEVDARESATRVKGLLATAELGTSAMRALGEAEWRDSYKAHFRAWQFGRLHWVPIWEREKFVLPAGDAVLWLDPGLAFGTGNHETTRLCVERLVAIAEQTGSRGRVIDAGCGSGILALSAAKLGFRDVAGFDNDADAVRVSEENAVRNDLNGSVRFFAAELSGGLAGAQAELVLANILADVLMKSAEALLGAVAPGGTLVLSGILASEVAQVRAVFAALAPGWQMESRTLGDWSDLLLQAPAS